MYQHTACLHILILGLLFGHILATSIFSFLFLLLYSELEYTYRYNSRFMLIDRLFVHESFGCLWSKSIVQQMEKQAT